MYLNIKEFILRWGYSTNHKDIGTLYIYYGAVAEIVDSLNKSYRLKKFIYRLAGTASNRQQIYNEWWNFWMKIYQTLKNKSKIQQNNYLNFRRNYTVKESLIWNQRRKFEKLIENKNIKIKIKKILEHPLIIDNNENLENKDMLDLTIMNTTHNSNDIKIGEKIIKKIELKNYEGEDGKRFLVLLKLKVQVKKQDYIEGKILLEDNRLNLEQKIQVLDEIREIVKELEILYYDIEKDLWGEDKQTLSLNETIEESIKSIK